MEIVGMEGRKVGLILTVEELAHLTIGYGTTNDNHRREMVKLYLPDIELPMSAVTMWPELRDFLLRVSKP